MADDFFISVAQQRYQELQADLAELNAGLLRARADGDEHTAKQFIQSTANARAEQRNLQTAYDEYVASQQPQHQGPSSEGEWMMKPPEKMTGEDVSKIFEKSKYVTRETWNDPAVAARVNAGWAELQRRRKSGQ